MKYKVNNIGAFIKEKRLKKDIKLRKLSAFLDKSPGYLSKVENGASNPSIELLKNLAEILEFQLADVVELPEESRGPQFDDWLTIDDLFSVPAMSIEEKFLTKIEQFQMLDIIKTIHRMKQRPEIDDLTHLKILLTQIQEYKGL
ncbi:helix-turn-helix transcriptional regulator [Bacillus sp. AFS096315]|uniref:helix-turn-helix domain-containing protein n=1 Tax=Bacillus sp. AFS096315 TaxID=2033517 RepID=UPI000BED8226|nr:helix-turn-helix transcriptional regulator [Bacillus sp. AFS096315]PEC46376.1 hypothetical protein CON00_23940 [Bacillus sp. AFS096315]